MEARQGEVVQLRRAQGAEEQRVRRGTAAGSGGARRGGGDKDRNLPEQCEAHIARAWNDTKEEGDDTDAR